jgi:hypothetical protein
MEWVVDIAKMPAGYRTREQWAALGEHHAQAMVARNLPVMFPDEWGYYSRAVLAGATHERMRLFLRREGSYWFAYVRFLEYILYKEKPHRRSWPLRKVV